MPLYYRRITEGPAWIWGRKRREYHCPPVRISLYTCALAWHTFAEDGLRAIEGKAPKRRIDDIPGSNVFLRRHQLWLDTRAIVVMQNSRYGHGTRLTKQFCQPYSIQRSELLLL